MLRKAKKYEETSNLETSDDNPARKRRKTSLYALENCPNENNQPRRHDLTFGPLSPTHGTGQHHLQTSSNSNLQRNSTFEGIQPRPISSSSPKRIRDDSVDVEELTTTEVLRKLLDSQKTLEGEFDLFNRDCSCSSRNAYSLLPNPY